MKPLRLTALACCLLASPVMATEDPKRLEQRARLELRASPNDADARFRLARALSWQRRYNEAQVEYAQLLKTNPDNADYLLGAAQVHLWRGAAAKALPLLAQARRRAPAYEDVWRLQIQALLALGDTARIRQAHSVRTEARRRFPQGDWRFAQLDGAPTQTPAAVVVAPERAPTAAAPAPAVAAIAPAAAAPGMPLPLPTAQSEPARQTRPRFTGEAGMAYEQLSNNLPAWREQRLGGEWRQPDGQLVYGGLRTTSRYGLSDQEAHLGGVFPAATGLQFQAEVGASGSHRVLPEHYLSALIHVQPATGWSLTAGVRGTSYDSGTTQLAQFGVDRYIGAERFGYMLYEGGPSGAGRSPSHRWQWAHTYGDRDWFALSVAHGRETEYAGAGFRTSQVRSLALAGRHEVAPDWAIAWEVGSHRQGDFYTRRGLRLGLRHAF